MANQPDGVIYMSPHDEPPTEAQAALVGRSRARLLDVLGLDDPAMGLPKRRGVVGACHVCGQTAPLTFEHIPPQSSGNRGRRRAVDQPLALAQTSLEFPQRGWTQQQRGMGAYVTCSGCNNLGGLKYVSAYSDFTASVVLALADAAAAAGPEDDPDPKHLQLAMQHIFPGDIVRQVFFMLLAVSGSAGLGRRFPDIKDMVLTGTPTQLPQDMRLLLTIVCSQRARLGTAQSEITIDPPSERVLVEVASTPFAWLLEYGDPSERTAADVSHWTEIAPEKEVALTIDTNTGFINTAVPGDYRPAQEVFPPETR